MSVETYRFERIDKEKLTDLDSLYKAAFNKSFSLNYLAKKFDTSHCGLSYIGFIAYTENGQPAGYYGLFPCYIEYNGKVILAAQSGDTMTHPLHQGKGLFTKLAIQTFELAKESGICFVFGFPNANSLPGFIKKLNWVEHIRLSIFTLHVNTIPLSSVASKSALLLRGYRKLIMLFWNRNRLKSFTSNSAIRDGFGGLLRDANHFNYKKYESNAAFQINGVPVWLKIDHRLLIGDIAACDEQTFTSIIRTLKFIARISGIRRIVFIANNDLSIAKRFASIPGVENATTLPYCYLNDYTSINPDAIRFTTADWDTF